MITVMISKDHGYKISIKEFEKIRKIMEVKIFIADNNKIMH